MQKTPLAFQGPGNRLSQLFSETTLYKACQLIIGNQVHDWQKPGSTGISRAHVDGHAVKLAWPIQDHSNNAKGQCDCGSSSHCEHVAALALLNRSRLSRIQPFTHQIKALQNINQTFMVWMQKQSHDPFPAMARHRVVYLLDEHPDKDAYVITIHKAYLSQDDRYTIKESIDNSLLWLKNRPKFVSLADQKVFYIMHELGLTQSHTIKLNAERDDELLKAIVETGRSFWRACYRNPIQLQYQLEPQMEPPRRLTSGFDFVLSENSVTPHKPKALKNIKLPQALTIKPRIRIHSEQIQFPWPPQTLYQFDWAALEFYVGDNDFSFSLSDVRHGRVSIDADQLTVIAGFCYLLDKLDSVHAHFESPISSRFEINDRFIANDFVRLATLLTALHGLGWDVGFADSFRLNRLSAKDWYLKVEKKTAATESAQSYGLELGVEVDGQQVNIMPYLVKAIKTGQFEQVQNELVLQLESGQMVGLDAAKVKQIIATMGELYSDKPLDEHNQITLPEQQLMQVARLQQSWQEQLPTKKQQQADDSSNRLKWIGDDTIKDKVKQLQQIKQLPVIKPPGGLKATLRDYQVNGFSWLCFLQEHQLHGLLADDMGLGKTIQTLALLLHQKQNNKPQAPSLLVAPTSLLGNWQAEAERFTPDLKVLILSGDNRDDLYKVWSHYDLVVTSYGIMNRDMTRLTQQPVHYLILDEAQAIKNRKTQTAQAAKAIPSKHRLCLTGTPVENHLGELWSMFDFLMPGFLGSEKLFQQVYQWPIEKEQNQERLQELQQRMAPFILRRTKSQVAKELPDKNEIVKMIDLNERQAHVYESIRLTMVDEIKQAFKDHQGNQILIGNALLRLRQVCCHPSLVKLASVDKSAPSAKLDWLKTAIANLVEEGRRILIFSSFTGMLSLIEKELKKLGIDYLSLTGKTPAKQRTQDIKRFQAEEVPVYLISLKAGGAGINLTAADTVIHYDPWWNPAAEQQASDRAHRIGQDKQVFVYKLISRGTVEEKIYQMQQKKSELASQLLTADSKGLKLSEHQWQDLLKPISA